MILLYKAGGIRYEFQSIIDAESLAVAEKHGVKPENIIRFDFDPNKPSDEQLQSIKEIIAERTGLR